MKARQGNVRFSYLAASSGFNPARRRALALCIWLSVPALSRPAMASGFVLYDQSAAALGQGSAVVGGTREPAAVWFNPAALGFMSAWGVAATGAAAHARTSFAPAGGGPDARTGGGPHLVPNLFAHAAVGERVQLGFGAYAPFGFAVRWPEGWIGAENSLETRIAIIALNPVLAVRLWPHVSVAVGASALRGDVEVAVALPSEIGGRADMRGGAWTGAANAALAWEVIPRRLHLGLTWRSAATVPLSGRVDFTANNQTFAEIFADQPARARLPLPSLWTAGLTWFVQPRWALGAQVDLARWSTFERLLIEFERPTTPPIIIDRQSRDAITLRTGASWDAWPRRAGTLRGGLTFDQATVAGRSLVPAAPDAHRLGLSLGAGMTAGPVRFDLGYLYLHFLDARTVGGTGGPAGTYRVRVHVLALTATIGARGHPGPRGPP